jgi:dihydroxyacetone kinase-like predicted kinase
MIVGADLKNPNALMGARGNAGIVFKSSELGGAAGQKAMTRIVSGNQQHLIGAQGAGSNNLIANKN